MLHPGREPLACLEVAKRNLGTLNFSAQYQQNPLPAEGNAIKRDWIRSYDRRPDGFEPVIASWDTASALTETADLSVGTVWGAWGQQYYLLDVVRGRWESPELRRKMMTVAQDYEVDATLIADTELGRAMSQDLRRTGQLYPLLQRARFDKRARLLAQRHGLKPARCSCPSRRIGWRIISPSCWRSRQGVMTTRSIPPARR